MVRVSVIVSLEFPRSILCKLHQNANEMIIKNREKIIASDMGLWLAVQPTENLCNEEKTQQRHTPRTFLEGNKHCDSA